MSKYDITNLKFLFNPRTVAVFGAGKDLNKVAGQVMLHLIMGKYGGKIYPINPKMETVLNYETIPSIKNIPEQIDLAIMAISKKHILSTLEECIDENVKFVIINTAGFQETVLFDEGGPSLQAEFKKLLRKAPNTRVVGPNCMGIASTSSSLNALMGINPVPASKENLNMSFTSQSGSWAAVALRCAVQHDLGVAKIVSTGNELDLTCEDFIEYFGLHDENTQVIGAFIEQLRNGRKFMKISSEITKPIIILRAGKTEAGAKAALSHTGSITSSSNLYESVFKQSGVIEAQSLAELMDYLRAFAIYGAKNKIPRGKRVGIYTVGGGLGVLTGDKCEDVGLDVVSLSSETVQKLNQVLPPIWSHNNPIDLIATRDFSSTEKVLKILLEAKEIDMIISIVPFGIDQRMENLKNTPNMPKKIEEFNRKMLKAYHGSVMEHLLKLADDSSKPIILPTSLYSTDLPFQYDDISKLYDAGICVVNSVEDAARTLAKLFEYKESMKKKVVTSNS